MGWTWDEAKNRANRQKHKINFMDAVRVFDDPYLCTVPDPYPEEARLRTFGVVQGLLIVVIHTGTVENATTGEFAGRIISARKATGHERRRYEEGNL